MSLFPQSQTDVWDEIDLGENDKSYDISDEPIYSFPKGWQRPYSHHPKSNYLNSREHLSEYSGIGVTKSPYSDVSISELKDIITRVGLDYSKCITKDDLIWIVDNAIYLIRQQCHSQSKKSIGDKILKVLKVISPHLLNVCEVTGQRLAYDSCNIYAPIISSLVSVGINIIRKTMD